MNTTETPVNLDLRIENMSFDTPWVGSRIRHVLQREGIHTLGDLLEREEGELAEYRGFGLISMTHLKLKLQSMGLKLKDNGW